MQVTIARQLGLEPTTVGNFFMNARRRSVDKWRDEVQKSRSFHYLDKDEDNQLESNIACTVNSKTSSNNLQDVDLDDDENINLDFQNDGYGINGESLTERGRQGMML